MNIDVIKAEFANYYDVKICYATNFMYNIENPTIEQIENAVKIGIPFIIELYKNERWLEKSYANVNYAYIFKDGFFKEIIDFVSIGKGILSGDDFKKLKDHGNVSIEFARELVSKQINELIFVNVDSYINEDFTYYECTKMFNDITEFDFLIESKIPIVIQFKIQFYDLTYFLEYFHIRYTETGELDIYVSDISCTYYTFLTEFEREQVKFVKLMGAL